MNNYMYKICFVAACLNSIISSYLKVISAVFVKKQDYEWDKSNTGDFHRGVKAV